jgi:aminoglycoside phosphotransferase (APT) family kinase protein
VPIDADLAARLIASQFPQWADLPVRPVELDGWDNRTFRLGDDMSVRLPSAQAYAAQVAKEQRWLPVLAPLLPLPVPVPLAAGVPALGYPWPWSVYRWLDGEPAATAHVNDDLELATTLARFLNALYAVDPAGGPTAGPHNFFRGGPLSTYDRETREAVIELGDRVDGALATEVWRAALDETWSGPDVWVHGDVGVANLLVRDGRLAAVIDFGTSGVGDPACDTVIAWTLLSGRARAAFRGTLDIDSGGWVRGRGWALWKSLITLRSTDTPTAAGARRTLDAVLADHVASS